MRCATCQYEPPVESAFCNRCGSPLRDRPMLGERRHLTIMFCDLVGSTELSQQIDGEELLILIREFQDTCARMIRNHEGHLAQYLGDGLLVYFGYPHAHEDDAIRAVSTGLEILAGVPELNASLSRRLPARAGKPLEVRIGIHSGPVVLSDMGRGGEQTPIGLGDTLNIAARLQAKARAGDLILSDATQRLVSGAFELEPLGRVALKGVREPVMIYRGLSSSGTRERFTRQASAGLTPLVGREHEIALALDRWEEAKKGRGQVVFLSGEPGIGKSRIVQVVHDRLGDESLTWLECRCAAHHENSAFHPVIDMLEQTLGIEDADSEAIRREKLASTLAGAGLSSRHVGPLVSLLSAPERSDATRSSSGSENPRALLLESLAACVLQLSISEPLVLAVEDLHWSDPSTLELLGLLLSRVSEQRVLLLFTFRSEFESPWDARANLVKIDFYPLTRGQIATLCASVAGRSLPETLLDELVAKADGIPLFAEELTKAVLETDWLEEQGDRLVLTGALRDLSIPSTLAESLMARLDGLGSAKQLAQVCAVIGRDIPHELLRAVSDLPATELRSGLERLVAANLLSQDGLPNQAPYTFRHALIQDTAYGSLLRTERRRVHARIARVLEEQFHERTATHPEDVAQHYDQAGDSENAVRFYQRAARQAVYRLAHLEAIGHLERAIELIGRLEKGGGWSRTELELQVALGTSTMIARGQGHPEVERAHARARDLSSEIDDSAGLFRALWGLSRFHQSQGKPAASHELGEQMLELARKANEPSKLCWAHLAVGQAMFWRGEPGRALEDLEATLASCEACPEPPDVHTYGQDPLVTSLSLIGPAHWMMGRPEQGLVRSHEAVETGQKGGDPFTHAHALCFGAVVHQMRGERAAAREFADAAIEISADRGFPLYLGFGRVMRGWSMTTGAGDESGVEELRGGIGDLQAAGTGLGGPFILGTLAEALRAVGRDRDALGVVESALALADQQQSHLWDSELLRLKGELRLSLVPDARDEAETLFRQALARARGTRAAGLELRVAMSLFELLSEGREREVGREILESVHRRFDEGFDTADLVAAKRLLSASA